MKFIKFLGTFSIIFGALMMFQNCGGPMGNTQLSSEELAQLSIREQSLALRRLYCLDCHNPSTGVADPRDILDDTALTNEGWIVPGKPDESHLYNSLFRGMPKGRAQLSDNEIQIFASWIKSMGEMDLQPSNIVISDSPTYDFGSVTTGEAASKTFTLKNTGEQEAKGLAGALTLPFRFKGGSFPGQGGDCAVSLAAGESCSIVIEFVPTSAVDFSKDLEIAYQDLEASKKSSLTLNGQGNGVSRALLVISNSPAYVFTSPQVGKNVSQTFTISNNGAAAAAKVNVSVGAGDFSVQGQTCSANLAATKRCTVTVRFAPTNTNRQTTTLKVAYNDGTDDTHVAITLSGNGLPVNTLYYSHAKSILQTSCGTCHTSEFGTYTNLLAFKRTGSSPAITPFDSNSRFIKRISGGPNQMGVGNYGSLSAVDQQKLISWILAGAPNDPVVSPALLNLSEAPTLDFGTVSVGSSLSKTLTLNNTGGGKAENINASALPAGFHYVGGSFPGTSGTCTPSLNAGQSCTLRLEFKPVNVVTYSGNLSLSYFDATKNTTVTRALKGVGKGMAIAVLEFKDLSAVDFGLVKAKSVVNKKITVKNNGSATAKNITAVALSSGFSFAGSKFPGTGGTCSKSLAANASCVLSLNFSGNSEGKFKSTLSLNFNNGSQGMALTLPLSSQVLGDEPVTFETIKDSLKTCFQCHASFKTYSGLMAYVKAGDTNSLLLQHVFGRNGKTQMGVGIYGSLDQSQRLMLEEWVKQGAIEYEKGSITQSFRPLLGDRYYVTSVLHRVFGEDERYVVPYTTPIMTRMDLFGSPCFTQDFVVTDATTGAIGHSFRTADSCHRVGISETRLGAEMSPASSAVAESTRQTACYRIAQVTQNITSALARAKVAQTAAFDVANLQKVYQRFLPGTVASQMELEALAALGNEAINNKNVKANTDSTKVLEGWRYVILSLCLSPKWATP